MNIKEIKDITQAMEAKIEKIEDALKSRSLTFIFIEAKLSWSKEYFILNETLEMHSQREQIFQTKNYWGWGLQLDCRW